MSLWKHGALVGACAVGTFAVVIPHAAAQSIPTENPEPSVPAVPAAPTVSAAELSSSTYRINPGDELEIYVWGEERLQRTVRVLPDGTLAFPLIGQVQARGMLPRDLERTVSERLRGQYRGQVPQVTVSVKSPAGMQFAVMGKVKSPGTFSPGRYTNILEALSLAGGPAEFANLDAVILLRKRGDRLMTMRFRLSSLMKSGTGDTDAARTNMEPGDMIIVP